MLKSSLDEITNKLSVEISREDIFTEPTIAINSSWEPSELAPLEDQLVVYLDIETTGLNPFDSQLIAIGIKAKDCAALRSVSWGSALVEGLVFWAKPNDDSGPLRRLASFIDTIYQSECNTIISSHNGYGFDWFYLRDRFELNRIPHPFVASSDGVIREVTSASINGMTPIYRDIFIGGDTYTRKWDGSTIAVRGKNHRIDMVDTLILAGMLDKLTADMGGYSLKYLACEYFRGREERRLELDYKQINQLWADQNLAPIEEYLRYDLEDQEIVTDALLTPHYYQKMFFPLSLQEICVVSPAKRWNSLLEAYYGKSNRPIADEKVDYLGGHVSANNGIYKNGWFKVDIASLYPSIMLKYGVLPYGKDPDGTFLKVLKVCKELRLKYKKLGGETTEKKEKRLYKGIDTSLKVVINASFGFLGTGGYPYNSMIASASITAYGREIMAQMLESSAGHAEVISTDTDGIFFSVASGSNMKPKEIHAKMQADLPEGIVLELENDYPEGGVYCSGMKNYLLFKSPDEPPIGKGVFRKRNRNKMQLDTPRRLSELAIYHTASNLSQWVKEVSNTIESGLLPVEVVVEHKRIPKSDKTLTEAGIGDIGDKLRYYWGSTELQMKTKTKRVRHPVKIDEFGNPEPRDGVDTTPFVDEYRKQFRKLVEDFGSNANTPELVDLLPKKQTRRKKACELTIPLPIF